MKAKGVALGGTLVLIGVVSVSVWRWRSGARAVEAAPASSSAVVQLAAAAGDLVPSEGVSVSDVPPALPTLSNQELLGGASRVVGSLRAEDWDVAALATSLGPDPNAAFTFVRDATAFDPYAGVLRGAEGTLAARAGNSWDRALLLAALLSKTGVTTRMAFTTLEPSTAAGLIERARLRPARTSPQVVSAGLLSDIAGPVGARARRDEAALRLALGDRVASLGMDEVQQARRDVLSHAWVQYLKDGAWVDLDPTRPDAKPGDVLAPAAATAAAVPNDRYHVVVIRVVAQALVDGKLQENVPLQHEVAAESAAHQHVLLAFLPVGGGGAGLLGGGESAPTAYVPTLQVDDEAFSGGQVALATSEGTGAGFDAFGGGGSEGPSSELVALYLEVETRGAGRPPTVARHLLLDRRQRQVERAFRGIHQIMISTGGANVLSMAKLRLEALDAAARDEEASLELPSVLRTLWASDLPLVEGAERLIGPAVDFAGGARSYIAEPHVVVASWVPDTTSSDLIRETDLLVDSVRVLPPDGESIRDAAARRFRYGLLQSALETETILRLAAAWDAADRTIITTSLSMGPPLTVFAPTDIGRLPDTTSPALVRALRGGETVVVPGEVARATAWWTVAASGFVRAILAPGTGGGKIGGGGRMPPVNPVGPMGKDKNQKSGSNEYGEVDRNVGQNVKKGGDLFAQNDFKKTAQINKILGNVPRPK